jgi:hypothetical protein
MVGRRFFVVGRASLAQWAMSTNSVGPTFMVGRPMINIGTTLFDVGPMINIGTTLFDVGPMIDIGST